MQGANDVHIEDSTMLDIAGSFFHNDHSNHVSNNNSGNTTTTNTIDSHNDSSTKYYDSHAKSYGNTKWKYIENNTRKGTTHRLRRRPSPEARHRAKRQRRTIDEGIQSSQATDWAPDFERDSDFEESEEQPYFDDAPRRHEHAAQRPNNPFHKQPPLLKQSPHPNMTRFKSNNPFAKMLYSRRSNDQFPPDPLPGRPL